MSAPLVSATDLGTYLNDTTINTARATLLIGYAQALCETVISPLPGAAAGVVARVAGRAYVTITSPRQAQLAASGSPFGGSDSNGMGGVWLSNADRAELESYLPDASSDAFTIRLAPPESVGGPWDACDGRYTGGARPTLAGCWLY